MMSDQVDIARTNAQTTQAQAVLESAKNRLTTTQQMLTTSQTNYVQATNLLLQQQNKLTEIQASLNKLTAANLSLVSIHSCTQRTNAKFSIERGQIDIDRGHPTHDQLEATDYELGLLLQCFDCHHSGRHKSSCSALFGHSQGAYFRRQH